MAIKRKIARIDSLKGQHGFLGPGHIAIPVIQGGFSATDPFILLMDDQLDKKDTNPAGGAHPHAGFETVSLLLEGEMGDTTHTMKSGDFQIMTAGKGIVHTETIDKAIKMRLLQMWLALPVKDRWTQPRVQDIAVDQVPVVDKDGLYIKVYSGSLEGVDSPIKNYTPLIVADIRMESNKSSVQKIPANYNSFLYVLEGEIMVGEDKQIVKKDQVGWMNILGNETLSELELSTGIQSTRFILYSAKPTGEPIYAHGPFIANTENEIKDLYRQYREGKMEHISEVADSQRFKW